MSINDITGDKIATKPASDKYRDNFDKIFGSKKKPTEVEKLTDRLVSMGTINFGFTPGSDPGVTPEQVAAAINGAIDQIEAGEAKIYPGGALPVGDCA